MLTDKDCVPSSALPNECAESEDYWTVMGFVM